MSHPGTRPWNNPLLSFVQNLSLEVSQVTSGEFVKLPPEYAIIPPDRFVYKEGYYGK